MATGFSQFLNQEAGKVLSGLAQAFINPAQAALIPYHDEPPIQAHPAIPAQPPTQQHPNGVPAQPEVLYQPPGFDEGISFGLSGGVGRGGEDRYRRYDAGYAPLNLGQNILNAGDGSPNKYGTNEYARYAKMTDAGIIPFKGMTPLVVDWAAVRRLTAQGILNPRNIPKYIMDGLSRADGNQIVRHANAQEMGQSINPQDPMYRPNYTPSFVFTPGEQREAARIYNDTFRAKAAALNWQAAHQATDVPVTPEIDAQATQAGEAKGRDYLTKERALRDSNKARLEAKLASPNQTLSRMQDLMLQYPEYFTNFYARRSPVSIVPFSASNTPYAHPLNPFAPSF